jgi:hypothetical protein
VIIHNGFHACGRQGCDVDGIDAGWLALSSLMHQIIRGKLDRLNTVRML